MESAASCYRHPLYAILFSRKAKDKMKYYVVSVISKNHEIDSPMGRGVLPLVWADGMCGVMPVFTDKTKATDYAGGAPVLEFISDETNQKSKAREKSTVRRKAARTTNGTGAIAKAQQHHA
jgi:hypothetical protein